MIIETLTIFYYSIASLSIGLVLCQTYNTQITQCINKWLYNYEPVNTDDNDDEENDLGLYQQLNNQEQEDKYILFNEMNQINNNEINNNEMNNNEINNEMNNNEINNNKNIKTKKNIIIDFE